MCSTIEVAAEVEREGKGEVEFQGCQDPLWRGECSMLWRLWKQHELNVADWTPAHPPRGPGRMTLELQKRGRERRSKSRRFSFLQLPSRVQLGVPSFRLLETLEAGGLLLCLERQAGKRSRSAWRRLLRCLWRMLEITSRTFPESRSSRGKTRTTPSSTLAVVRR